MATTGSYQGNSLAMMFKAKRTPEVYLGIDFALGFITYLYANIPSHLFVITFTQKSFVFALFVPQHSVHCNVLMGFARDFPSL